ncbi:hydrogenase maturation nickel metallochaperone HypA [Winogradskyella alexanderae]|uniref:Hydrogenase maturation factor HypA n=1 Tax=Winogradskyella alexanderae TaxID=2877123 RepID=A0ABS7XQK5_9FLAO|nr:hydrogenase maturation nickel metallochaperone HypA [Winogradskyella alexanderae]MCA0132282.1 hydrogenase maturation nickel metallochaperone HypA [Winogradskyella alexanderae]
MKHKTQIDMHELSIAMSIVRIAENEATKANASKVDLIELEIGTLAGIEFEALDFVWPSAVKDTKLEHAEKKINKINGEAKCNDCHTVFPIDDIIDNCPKCGSFSKTIIKGKELLVKSLEVS